MSSAPVDNSPDPALSPDTTSSTQNTQDRPESSDASDYRYSAHRVVLPVFEGPLDLLLHLVKVHEMDINDIKISEITNQYMSALEDMQALNLEVAGDFLVMAATLLNIKSRSLLPRREEEMETPEEEIDEILSTQDLIRKLVEYRKFKEISQSLKNLEFKNAGVYYRSQVVSVVPGTEEDEIPRQDIRILYEAFSRVLRDTRRTKKASHEIVRERFSVDEKMHEIRHTLRVDGQMNMSEVFKKCYDKEEVITYFLATLEMAKLREITLAQAETYEDIFIAPWNEDVEYA